MPKNKFGSVNYVLFGNKRNLHRLLLAQEGTALIVLAFAIPFLFLFIWYAALLGKSANEQEFVAQKADNLLAADLRGAFDQSLGDYRPNDDNIKATIARMLARAPEQIDLYGKNHAIAVGAWFYVVDPIELIRRVDLQKVTNNLNFDTGDSEDDPALIGPALCQDKMAELPSQAHDRNTDIYICLVIVAKYEAEAGGTNRITSSRLVRTSSTECLTGPPLWDTVGTGEMVYEYPSYYEPMPDAVMGKDSTGY
jgi:uncharacterized membrane protein